MPENSNSKVVMCQPHTDPFYLSPEREQQAKEELNETREIAEYNINILRKNLEETDNLVPQLDDIFLTSFLRAKKHNVEKALKMIKEHYKMKYNYPNYYKYCFPTERRYVYELFFHVVLPQRTSTGRGILIVKAKNMDPKVITPEDVIQAGLTTLKLLSEDPELQVSGIVMILDLGGFNLFQQAKLVTPRAVWIVINLLQDTFPMRLREIHIVNEPFFFEALYALFKPFLKEKFKQRIKIHGKNMSSLYHFICPDILPAEYGGSQPASTNEHMIQQIENNEDKIKDWQRYGYCYEKHTIR
ncbi:alpha-tocopherol transfer protein-like [Lycorma delicatula]|uniref:alpha-tocopherol transfer protein-like n=1 Tax=Lycorma delicatula TaxID=130591 RepID=UPI003F510B83